MKLNLGCLTLPVFVSLSFSALSQTNFNGPVGIGTSGATAIAPLQVVGSGTDTGTTAQYSGVVAVQANTGGRSMSSGAELEFILPAAANGTNPWGQARLLAVAGNTLDGYATGKLMMGTRRYWDKANGLGRQWYYGTDITIDGAGLVGIGTSTPNAKLQVDPGGAGGIYIGNSNGSSGGYTALSVGISAYQNGYAQLQAVGSTGGSWGTIVLNQSGGSVAIGTNNAQGYLLAVNGSAVFTQVVVKPNANWPDFVFDKGYAPLPLESLRTYIDQNKHLPGLPTATKVEAGGQDLGEIQRVQVQKIEELTLYAIDADRRLQRADSTEAAQQKTLEALMKEVELQQREIKALEKEMKK